MTTCIILRLLALVYLWVTYAYMNLRPFKILNLEEAAPIRESSIPYLLNLDHIVSVKPINILIRGNLHKGYWIRLSNGKKYRALEIPQELENLMTNFDTSKDSINGLPFEEIETENLIN